MTTELDSLEERFQNFLRSYTDEQGALTYWNRVQRMSLNDETSLSVDFQDLASFDSIFITEAAETPSEFIRSISNALVSILRIEDPDYIESIDEGIIKVRITNYLDTVPLRAIRSRHIGHLIRISGIMMRASEVKPLLVKAVFECRICSNPLSHELEGGRYSEPVMCPTCMKKTPMKLLPEESQFIDWQRVRIQESPEELPPGQMPRSVDVTLEGDIVDISRPGDLVKVSGILQTSPDFSRRGGKLATFNVFIEANGVEITEKEYEQLEISDEEEKRIHELSEDPYIHERIFASIAPSIHGHEFIKESIALLLFGGVGKTLPDGTRLRGRSNILMIGDPGTGKSQILKFVAKLASRSLYTSGKGTTAAGLTAAVVHDTDTGSMTLEAGALVLADQGIACIDEFDKMDPNDRTAIHEAMEQHSFHPSTEILLTDGRRLPIGSIVDRLFDAHPKRVVQGVNCEIVDTISLNLELYTTNFITVRKVKVDRVSRHTAPDYFIEVAFGNGRKIVVTPDHPLFIYKDGDVRTIPAEDAMVGAFVPAPRKMPCGHNPGAILTAVQASHKPVEAIIQPARMSNNLARILGYFVTEGYRYDESTNEIEFSTTSVQIKNDLLNLMQDIFGIESVDYVERNRTIRFVSVQLMDFFSENFPEIMNLSTQKRIPSQLFKSGEKAIISFLKSAFIGAGAVESEEVSYRTASSGLACDYQDLLLGIGLQSKILADSHNNSYKVVIRSNSLPLFRDKFVEEWDSRLERIDQIIKQSSRRNDHHDVFLQSFGERLMQLSRRVGITHDCDFYRSIQDGFGITRYMLRKCLDSIINARKQVGENFENASDSLKSLRKILKWSQETAAQKIGISKSSIYHLENGDYSIELLEKTIEKLKRSIRAELDVLDSEIEKIESHLEGILSFLRIESIRRIDNAGPYSTEYVYDVTVEPEHSFISQGTILHNTVSIAKAGIVATLNARTSILAAANPTLGRYEPSLSIQDNIKLPFTILSRFDLIWILVDTVEESKDRELAKFILGMHRMQTTKEKETIPPIEPDFLKKYIGYANIHVTPQLTAEAAEVIESFYVGLRSRAEGGAAPVPITARQLEALVRLSEARARVSLNTEVSREDAQAAVHLMEESLRMVAFDPVTKRIDIDRIASPISASQRNASEIILAAMKAFEAEGKSSIEKETLLQRVSEMGLSKERAEEALSKLLTEGILFNPGGEKIKRP
ncbi:MAG: helix-turn-helix domain-containing protein [Candidatus Lokiarchaeota archaeon]|nr:helix-turn-helix domain-containing protein [Candidatus Lokiarchaeota archaeon]